MLKQKFKIYQSEKAIPCSAGSRMKSEYQVKLDGNNEYLVKVGEIDIQKKIESFEDGVSLPKMIERFMRGDDTALKRKNGFFGDASGFSDNPAEVITNTRVAMNAMRSVAPTESAPTESAPTEFAPTEGDK